MIKIKETKITNVTKNKYQELKITFLIKKEDYNWDLEDKIFELSKDWILWAFVFQEIEIKEEKSLSKLLSNLHFFMWRYCEMIGSTLEDEKTRIYKKYNINSRSSLTIDQLEYEIDSYKAWCNSYE